MRHVLLYFLDVADMNYYSTVFPDDTSSLDQYSVVDIDNEITDHMQVYDVIIYRLSTIIYDDDIYFT